MNQQQKSVNDLKKNGWEVSETTDLGSVLLVKGNMVSCVYFDGSVIEYRA